VRRSFRIIGDPPGTLFSAPTVIDGIIAQARQGRQQDLTGWRLPWADSVEKSPNVFSSAHHLSIVKLN
jgi:hypothetical protein